MTKFIYFLILTLTPFLHAEQEVKVMRKKWSQAISKAPSYPEDTFSGRGIVIPAGGAYYLTNAYINLHMLRDSGCELPVEIWYIGKKEFIPSVMKKLEEMGAVCKDITDYFSYPIKGYEVKIHAILASSFEEVMLIDADNIAFRNPDFLFETEAFIETGALFWPDVQALEPDNVVWNILKIKPQKVRAQESGQIVLDKKRCWLPLQLCCHLNKESSFYYQHLLGDKDTFHLSWRALNYPYFMAQHIPGILKKPNNASRYGFGQIQRDFDGAPLFCHTTTYNWAQRLNYRKIFYAYTLPDRELNNFNNFKDFIHKDFQTVFPGFEERCLEYLKEVKEILRQKG